MAGEDNQFSFSTAIFLVSFIAIGCPSVVNGQYQVGVSLKLGGVTIPNNSLVDFDDLLYTTNDNENPTNGNGHDQTLVCETDLVDCCDAPHTVRGNWYFPNGDAVASTERFEFHSNRGPNEAATTGQLGSVRIFRRYTPTERGRFRCELPSAADLSVNQTLYANIVDFGTDFRVPPVTISPSGSTGTAGETYSLTCSTTLNSNSVPFPSDVPSPTFEWFFGPNNSSLPSGVIAMATTFDLVNTFISTLQFSPLSQSRAGMYTCRLGPGRLANHAMVTVNAPAISVQITTSGVPMLGQNGYSLTCGVSGAGNLNPTITYQWTKNNGTQTQIQVGANSGVLSFSPLRLSDAGQYTCQATISSPYLNDDIITTTDSGNVTIQIPFPSLVISSNIPNPIRPVGSAITLTCTVELNPAVDVPVTVTTMWTGPAGFMTTNTAQPVMGSTTTYTSTAMVNSFGRDQSGVYTCEATLSSDTSVIGGMAVSGMKRITIGVYLSLKGTVYANNSVILITEIASNTGLQCITDRSPCCGTQGRAGQWYFPDGNQVPVLGVGATKATTFYRNRGDDGSVNLNRLSDIMSPTGLFCCEIPDATNIHQRVCANIVFYNVVITPSAVDTPTAGETYSLDCSVSGTTDPVTYQWFEGPASSGTQLSSVSQLEFSPLRASDAGLYTCQATVGGVMVEGTTTVTISLPAPITVTVTPPMGSMIIISGSSPILTCTVELSPAVDVPVTVDTVWTGPTGFRTTNTAQPVMGSTTTYTSTATISSIGIDQSGNYTCTMTVRITSSDVVGYSSSRIIVVPEPTFSLHSDSPNPILSGSSPTLTCTVEFGSSVSVPLSVNTVWKGPNSAAIGSSTTLTSEMKSFTLYTSSSTLNSVESADSGKYTCTVSFEDGVEMLASTNITIVDGMLQLGLKSVGICQQWYNENSEKSEQYRNFIKGALVRAIERHCKCRFPITNLLNDDVFICEDSPNLILYRNTLLGTHNFNGTEIIGFIQDWVNTGPLIKIGGNFTVRVDSSCLVAVSSLDEPECGQKKEECLYDDDPKYAMCAEQLNNANIAHCFEGCVVRNG